MKESKGGRSVRRVRAAGALVGKEQSNCQAQACSLKLARLLTLPRTCCAAS